MLWWAGEAPMYAGNVWTGPYQGAFSEMGAGGQYITAFPASHLVVVHKATSIKTLIGTLASPRT